MNKTPLIGICTLYPTKHLTLGSSYGAFLRHGSKVGVITYIFSPKDINWLTKTIRGFVLVNNIIVKKNMPFPQVVYNKLENRNQEANPLIKSMWQKFRAMDIKFFNPKFFNKIEIHRLLSTNSALSSFIPETMLHLSQENIEIMLRRHYSIYVKPGGGSLGMGVIKIQRDQNGYIYKYRSKDKRNVSIKVSNTPTLFRRITPLVGKRPIIQQGINIATHQGRVFDLRVLMQKNGSGRWTRTFSFGKLAAPGSIAANVAAGGKVIKYHQILKEIIPNEQKRKMVEEQIQKICSLVPSTLDKHYVNLGELGIDLGIDRIDRVWIIEVNSKYSRHVFPRQVRINSILKPLAYAKLLASR